MKYKSICKECGKQIVISDPPDWASNVFGKVKNYKPPKICRKCVLEKEYKRLGIK